MSEELSSDFEGVTDTVELRARVRTGDRSAFQALYERLAPALYAWMQLRVRGTMSGGPDVQELLQEVWIRALHGIDGYDPASSFRGWVFGISKNVFLQAFRDFSRERARVSLSAFTNSSAAIPESVTSISSRLGKDEVVQRFLAYVAELGPEERQLLLYCGLEGYTSAQAAERLGILQDTALKRWQSLRARLRENGTLKALALEVV